MRLIDADALKNALIECTPYAIDPVYRNTNSNIDMFTAMEILDELPTIDAAPVVRGKWIQHHETTTDNETLPYGWECSLCGRWEMEKQPFCNCSEKMEDKP